MINSPLTLQPNISIKSEIYSNEIIERYKSQFDIETSSYFNRNEKIVLFQCPETKYMFFYPFTLSGDSHFYEQLQKFDWYYMPWKWEHQITLSLTKEGYRILEVGSGGNGFIEKLHSLGYKATGLELNESSVEKGTQRGLDVIRESVQEHSHKNEAIYDLVCSFQVLEHIAEVRSFIEAQIKCLKSGGKLIISVPNNGAFIKYTPFNILNMPPHHMGLWDKHSLTSLVKIFPIKLNKIYYEPLQSYHYSWYQSILESRFIRRFPIIRKVYVRLQFGKLLAWIIKKTSRFIKGHSILVVYTKL